MGSDNAETVAVTGASGLIGSAVGEKLRAAGYRVVALKRVSHPTPVHPGWNPQTGEFFLPEGQHCDVFVHSAGEPIAARWTPAKKRAIYESRVELTRRLSEHMAALEQPPHTFICISAIGIYGHRGDNIMTENDMAGTGFLATVVTAWEDAAKPAKDAGIRVIYPRLGVVLSKQGGALVKMLPFFKLGLGGALGNGRQWMSWVSLEDAADSIVYTIQNDSIRGAVNITAPTAATSSELARTLGEVLHRPALFPTPAFVLRLMFTREGANEMLLSSTRVAPMVLQKNGYVFRFPDLKSALEHELGYSE
jgi:uncharacterized protein (TIGR01777 family)